MQKKDEQIVVRALKVHQWLKEWDDPSIKYDPILHRRKPENFFFLFTISARTLKSLSGINRRDVEELDRSKDIGIQRRHDAERSKEIAAFSKYGYPWSELSDTKRQSGKFDNLRKPGWLPTAIVVNILKPEDDRNGEKVAKDDLITVTSEGDAAYINLPINFKEPWKPKAFWPIEVIDGQHRLWAFEDGGDEGFELPVVAFYGLDISWQAYLFWSINIKPKKINASLAFDLYPLLRAEDWLEKLDGHSIYRETRAQELTSALWSYPNSPWYQRINMLGDPGKKMVSQAAWINSLTATYIKPWEGRGVSIGGLFGAPIGDDEQVLPWTGSQQAAFLIYIWEKLRNRIQQSDFEWAKLLREEDKLSDSDPAFFGSSTLLNNDQGVRGVLYLTNDMCYEMARKLKFRDWIDQDNGGTDSPEAISMALESITKTQIAPFIDNIIESIVDFDWRSSSAKLGTDQEYKNKLVFRGTSGYRELRRQLLQHVYKKGGENKELAKNILDKLGFVYEY